MVVLDQINTPPYMDYPFTHTQFITAFIVGCVSAFLFTIFVIKKLDLDEQKENENRG